MSRQHQNLIWPAAILFGALVHAVALPGESNVDQTAPPSVEPPSLERVEDLMRDGYFLEAADLGRELLRVVDARQGHDSVQAAEAMLLIAESHRQAHTLYGSEANSFDKSRATLLSPLFRLGRFSSRPDPSPVQQSQKTQESFVNKVSPCVETWPRSEVPV